MPTTGPQKGFYPAIEFDLCDILIRPSYLTGGLRDIKGTRMTDPVYSTNVPYISNLQINKRRAKKLLSAYRNGDSDAVRCFKERHPRGKDSDFVPQLIDARVVTVSDAVRPRRLLLEPLKKQAKHLLREWRGGNEETLKRVTDIHPKTRIPAPDQAKLADAQFIIAREQGLASWPKLKAHIEALDQANRVIGKADTNPAPDLNSVHIRCGTDIGSTLPKVGLKGTFFNLEEIYVCGPLNGGADHPIGPFLEARARYLSEAFPQSPAQPERDMSFEAVFFALKKDRAKLKSLIQNHDTLCLWFEHDAHDQLILAMLLHLIAGDNCTANIEIVSPDRFPGLDRFLGLGQLTKHPEMIRMLWEQRSQVTTQQIAMGQEVWPALCAANPGKLWKIAQSTDCPLPHMPRALHWHLKNLPDVNNGLSTVEQQILQIFARDGAMNVAKLFMLHSYEVDPLPTLGDLSYHSLIGDLINVECPAVRYQSYDPGAPILQRGDIELTDVGRALLANEINWLEINDINRWVGGIEIKSGHVNWCWHPDKGILHK